MQYLFCILARCVIQNASDRVTFRTECHSLKQSSMFRILFFQLMSRKRSLLSSIFSESFAVKTDFTLFLCSRVTAFYGDEFQNSNFSSRFEDENGISFFVCVRSIARRNIFVSFSQQLPLFSDF